MYHFNYPLNSLKIIHCNMTSLFSLFWPLDSPAVATYPLWCLASLFFFTLSVLFFFFLPRVMAAASASVLLLLRHCSLPLPSTIGCKHSVTWEQYIMTTHTHTHTLHRKRRFHSWAWIIQTHTQQTNPLIMRTFEHHHGVLIQTWTTWCTQMPRIKRTLTLGQTHHACAHK